MNGWQVFFYDKNKGMTIIPRMACTKIFSLVQDTFTSFNREAMLLNQDGENNPKPNENAPTQTS